MKKWTVMNIVYAVLWLPQKLLFPITVKGRENVPEGPCILCPNHSNFTDPILLVFALRKKYWLNFMSKKENMTVPVLGWIYKKLGAFGVDRDSQDIAAFRTTRTLLKNGEKVVIFPEGTRTSVDDVNAGHPGAVRFAARQNVPVVPVYITRDKKAFRRADIVIGEPYHVAGRSQEDFEEATRDLMGRIFALGETNED